MNHLGHRLSGYLDGELPPTTAELVAGHLALCPSCRTAAVDQSRTKGDLRELGGPVPSDGLLSSLLQLPGSASPTGPHPGRYSQIPTAPIGRRKRPSGVPLFAAGVAGVAALTMASAVFTGAAPQRAHHVTARPAVAGGRVRTQPTVQSVARAVAPAAPTHGTGHRHHRGGAHPVRLPLTASVELIRGPG